MEKLHVSDAPREKVNVTAPNVTDDAGNGSENETKP